jgi:hypothetical protein
MNDEYLWDKNGEPDPEIQELEQILEALRYQPKPLVLPDDVRPVQRNHRLPLVAIAASLLVALLAAGLWLVMTKKSEQPLNAKTNVLAAPSPLPEQASVAVKETPEDVVSPKAELPGSNKVVKNVRRSTRIATPRSSTAEREQANQVKQQLMVALRVASEKLNLAQRKTQGPSPNQIRNQHKVG